MLSPVPLSDDKGNACTLPNGEKVRLRDTFRSSGFYRIGSTTPIWTVKWYAEKGLVNMSEDGRYVVRINRFGGGGYGGSVQLGWGIGFYDAGVELKAYQVSELVDYPSLMEFTSYDWHLIWIDWDSCDRDIHDGVYRLCTSCREKYTFDVTTGSIIEESRYWRRVARCTYAALIIIGIVGVSFFYRHRKSRRLALARNPPSEKDGTVPVEEGIRLQYSLRSLMILVTVVAIHCSIFRIAPHIGVFVSSISVAGFLTYLLWRGRQRIPYSRRTLVAKGVRVLLWAVVLVSWFLAYTASMAPVTALTYRLGWPHDARMAVVHGVYGPVWWLLMDCDFGRWGPIEVYFAAYGAHLI
jgi:hypothetical protein